MSRYGVFSGPGKYGPEETPYLDTVHAVILILSERIWRLHNFVCDIVKLFEKWYLSEVTKRDAQTASLENL